MNNNLSINIIGLDLKLVKAHIKFGFWFLFSQPRMFDTNSQQL